MPIYSDLIFEEEEEEEKNHSDDLPQVLVVH